MRIATFLLFISLMALTGCVVESEQPLYTEADLIFDPNLLGTWADKKGAGKIQIDKSGETAYLVAAEGETEKCALHMLRLGDALFLDLEDEKHKDKHLILRLSMKKNRLRLSSLENC